MVDTKKPIRFYDDRSKCLDLVELKDILFINSEVCLCKTEDGENVLFDIETGEVLTDNYFAWYATNDWMQIKEENERIRRENA